VELLSGCTKDFIVQRTVDCECRKGTCCVSQVINLHAESVKERDL
jgi:hypothetical protein